MNTRSKNAEKNLDNLPCLSQRTSESCRITEKTRSAPSKQTEDKNNNKNPNNCSEEEQARTLTSGHNSCTEVNTQDTFILNIQ